MLGVAKGMYENIFKFKSFIDVRPFKLRSRYKSRIFYPDILSEAAKMHVIHVIYKNTRSMQNKVSIRYKT